MLTPQYPQMEGRTAWVIVRTNGQMDLARQPFDEFADSLLGVTCVHESVRVAGTAKAVEARLIGELGQSQGMSRHERHPGRPREIHPVGSDGGSDLSAALSC